MNSSRSQTALAITPGTYARRLGVGIHKVLGWISRGELAALNVASDTAKRPQWAILPEAVADFERRRTAQPRPPTPRRRRREQVIQYF